MFTILFITFVLLNIGDGITTYYALRSKNNHEANKIMAWLMSKIGVLPALILVKTVGVCIMYYLMSYLDHTVQIDLMFIFNLVYGYVVYHNYRLI